MDLFAEISRLKEPPIEVFTQPVTQIEPDNDEIAGDEDEKQETLCEELVSVYPVETVATQRKAYYEILPLEAQRAFDHGFQWVQAHRQELIAAGWTAPELFRRSKFRYSVGSWGVAWLSVWLKPGLSVSFNDDGKIIFTLRRGERTVVQSVRPGIVHGGGNG